MMDFAKLKTAASTLEMVPAPVPVAAAKVQKVLEGTGIVHRWSRASATVAAQKMVVTP